MVPADTHPVFGLLLVECVGHGQVQVAVWSIPEGNAGHIGVLLIFDSGIFFHTHPGGDRRGQVGRWRPVGAGLELLNLVGFGRGIQFTVRIDAVPVVDGRIERVVRAEISRSEHHGAIAGSRSGHLGDAGSIFHDEGLGDVLVLVAAAEGQLFAQPGIDGCLEGMGLGFAEFLFFAIDFLILVTQPQGGAL